MSDEQKVGVSRLVYVGEEYPGVRCFRGERNTLLVGLAQDCADTLARRGDKAYWDDGHPGWDARYREIRATLGMTAVEVSAFSWPQTSEELTNEIVHGMFFDWQRSDGHWNVVSTEHKMYGDALAKSLTNVWFGVVITAD